MKALLLDVMEGKVETVDADGVEEFYKLLHCTTIDIVQRIIGDRWYDIVCDDNGTFVENPRISAVDSKGQIMLVGNLLICGLADADGVLTSLSEEDIEHIKESIQKVKTVMHPEGLLMIDLPDGLLRIGV